MSDVPVWIQVLQALSTPAIALGGGLVAYRQWRTAQQKVVLDLFDRRWALYNEILAVVQDALRGTKADTDDSIKVGILSHRATFIFGDDVVDQLKVLEKTMANLSVATTVIANVNQAEHQQWLNRKHESLEELLQFLSTFPPVCRTYMRMAEKQISLRQQIIIWLRDRNRQRLSYADEKQR
ncbi:hypothetical protein ACXHMN_18730 [Rhizobium sp. LEGMi12c]